jgi:hypothetical protein
VNTKLLIKLLIVAVVAEKTIFSDSYLLYPVYAADATVSAKTSSPSASIQEKLKALQAEIASKAAKLKTEINQKLNNKAYVGKVISKNTNSLIILTLSGNKSVKVNEYTTYSVKNFAAITTDNYVAALGDVDDNDILTAKKIVVLKNAPFEPTILSGTVTANTGSSLTLQQTDSSANITFDIDSKTTVINAGTSILRSEIQTGKVIAAVLLKQISTKESSNSGNLKARFIYLPSNTSTKPKVASPSATVAATATPKPSASASSSAKPKAK